MVRTARRRLLAALRRFGGFDLVRDSDWRRRRLVILCYHGVSLADEHEWNNQLYVSPDALRQRFETLKRHRYNVLPLREALERLRAGTLPPRSAALTFDDGAYDFHERAFPLLREYGYPATVYLTTYYCQHQWPVFDTGCAYVLWKSGRATADVGRLVPGVSRLPLDTDADRRRSALAIRESATRSGLSGQEKDDLLRRISKRIGVDYDEVFFRRLLFLMTPAEVREVAAAAVDVQLHTHRHRTPDDPRAFRSEIDDNRCAIEQIVGPGERDAFCYPSGIYDSAFFEWLAASGVRTATTCDAGLAHAHSNMLLLPRLVDTMNISPLEFEARLAGVTEWIPRRRAAHAPRPPGEASGRHRVAEGRAPAR